MSTEPVTASKPKNRSTSARAEALAVRLEQGAAALESLARSLTEAEWQMRGTRDARKVGVLVHHVGNMYPIEIQLAQLLAAGKPVEGVTWDAVANINGQHAKDNEGVTKEAALAFLKANSTAAAAAVRAFSDEELDRANTVSLNANAPLTCQFFVEDHALRHSYHHLAAIRTIIKR